MGELLSTIRRSGLRPMLRLLRGRRGLEQIMTGHYVTRMLQALLSVGFFEEMRAKGGVDVAAFAEAKGLDEDVLAAICAALYALRIFTCRGNAYSLEAQRLVHAGSTQGWLIASSGYEEILHSLEALLRKEKVYPHDVTRHIEAVTAGYAEVERTIYFPLIEDRVRQGGFRRVLDLGCGDGTFLRHLCARTAVTGYGLDLSPQAIAAAVRHAAADGLAGRIHLAEGDMARLDQLPRAWRAVDLAVTFFVLHEILYWGEDRILDVLRGFRSRFPGVPLVVFEVDRPTVQQLRSRPGLAVVYLFQHDLTRQRPVARQEWRRIFTRAGFTSIEEVNLWFARTVVFTLR